MKYVFFGTPEFAAVILGKLLALDYIPAAVVCNPDRPVGRKQIVTPPPVKRVIHEKELADRVMVLQPETLATLRRPLTTLLPDLFIVAAYAKILPAEFLTIPRLGAVGVHPSLLPKYRGTTPIQSAILSGEEETGVTLYLLDPHVDNGPILQSKGLKIKDKNYETLSHELAELGGELLIEAIPQLVNGELKPLPQDESRATYTKKFKSEDGFIDAQTLTQAAEGSKEAPLVWRKIRALNPEPGVSTIDERGRRVKLLEAELTDGKLVLTKTQREGKTPQTLNPKP